MKLVPQLIKEETFTFTPDDGTPEINIRSGALRKWLHANVMDKVMNITFQPESLESIIERHGLEADRMASMTMLEAAEPVIIGLWPTGTHVLIDGGHRRWFWAKRGQHTLRGWAVPLIVWSEFIYDPNDPAIIKQHEGGSMLPHRRKS